MPIHSALIKRGILSYIDEVQKQGAKLLFPSFKPSRGKASGEAEKWFRQFLKDVGLRDDTHGAKVLGMHAFRSTFSNAAMNAGVDESSIVGHAGEGRVNDDGVFDAVEGGGGNGFDEDDGGL